MRDELLAALARREERVTIGGLKLVVREMENAADVAGFEDGADYGYKLVVRCVFDEAGAPVFTDDDISALKGASRVKFLPVIAAVNRVNGIDVEGEVKNSAAAPA